MTESAKLIELEALSALVGEPELERGRDAMDLESIAHYRFERRGRVQAVVKPAPPSEESASYARITKRGSGYFPDCRQHGKDRWCLHTVILALYHMGHKPSFSVRHAEEPQPDRVPRLGFQLIVEIAPERACFKIFALSSRRFVQYPMQFLVKEPQTLGLPAEAMEILEDVAVSEPDGFYIERMDLAPVLVALGKASLYSDTRDTPFLRINARRPFPRLEIHIRDQSIFWKLDEPIESGTVFLPGWPGFTVLGKRMQRYPGYVPDLQFLGPGDSGSLPLNPENLLPFLRIKHHIDWQSRKPEWLSDVVQPGLHFEVRNRELEGSLGFWHLGRFLKLDSLNETRQLLRGGDGRLFLLDAGPWRMMQVSAAAETVRAPWQGAGFRIRENQAPSFLEGLVAPEGWHVDRERADRWFGIEPQPMDHEWGRDGLPVYRIGDERFDHRTLIAGLMENRRGVRLPDGRMFNVDTLVICRNDRILEGVRRLHDREEDRTRLIRRIISPEEADTATQKPPALPKLWEKLLRPYQREGADWLLQNAHNREPSLLADDMGLGKTVQTLAFLDGIRDRRPQLVVVPASLVSNWAEECARFCPHRVVTVHHGPKRTRQAGPLNEADLVITSYGTVLRDGDLLYDIAFQVVVLDEAQTVKNPSSQTARAVTELWRECGVALTGTPIENRITELWSIFRFLAPGYLGDEDAAKQVGLPGTPAFEALKAKVRPFLKRRLKSEVATELPDKQEITVRLPMTPLQAGLYEKLRKGSMAELERKELSTFSILTKLLRLRQVCCHPGLFDEGRSASGSNKLDFLMESLGEMLSAGHAALVFSQFTRLLALVKFALEERGIPFLYLDGRTKNRQELVHRFQAGEAPVFLISLKAGGTGLNLQRASYVYHLDPWWNPMVEAQATDRAHRIGQDRKVISYKLISEGTVEERILRLQAQKKFLAEELWNDRAQSGSIREALAELLT